MSAATVLQGPLFAAYMVGRCTAYRERRMNDARKALEAPLRHELVIYARDWNRQVVYWLKRVQS